MKPYALCALLALPAFAQTVNSTTITTSFPDALGGIYTVQIPYTVSVQAGTAVVTYAPPIPPPPPPPPPPTGAPPIPSTAKAVILDPLTWKAPVHDTGTPGTSTGTRNYPVSGVTADNTATAFAMSYTGAGGERYAVDFANDTVATNYVYAVTFTSPDLTHLANLELDINQTKSNGKTSILGTQCSIYSHTWEVTLNSTTGSWHWVPSNVPCDPTKWAPNTPHTVRIFGTIDATGSSTYLGVEFDGAYSAFNGAAGQTGRALSWAIGSNLTNFQIDGLGTSGSVTIYTDSLTMYRW